MSESTLCEHGRVYSCLECENERRELLREWREKAERKDVAVAEPPREPLDLPLIGKGEGLASDLAIRIVAQVVAMRDGPATTLTAPLAIETAVESILRACLASAAPQRQACACAEPDPVMQADRRFYCHTCSFQTGARPQNLEPEDAIKRAFAVASAAPQEAESDRNKKLMALAVESADKYCELAQAICPDEQRADDKDWPTETLVALAVSHRVASAAPPPPQTETEHAETQRSSGCTDPDFPGWWETFGQRLSQDARINAENVALAAFSTGRAREQDAQRSREAYDVAGVSGAGTAQSGDEQSWRWLAEDIACDLDINGFIVAVDRQQLVDQILDVVRQHQSCQPVASTLEAVSRPPTAADATGSHPPPPHGWQPPTTDAIWKVLNEADDNKMNWSSGAWRQWFVEIVDAVSGFDNALERTKEQGEQPMKRYGCHQCQQDFSHEPVTFSIPGIPARTYFFCSPACRENWHAGKLADGVAPSQREPT